MHGKSRLEFAFVIGVLAGTAVASFILGLKQLVQSNDQPGCRWSACSCSALPVLADDHPVPVPRAVAGGTVIWWRTLNALRGRASIWRRQCDLSVGEQFRSRTVPGNRDGGGG
jgi:hypothetical protein